MQPIQPDGIFKTTWDVIGFLMIIYEAISIPYRVAFNIPTVGLAFELDLIIDLFFLADVALNFNIAYYKRGTLVTRRRRIVRKYLKTWFALDLIASIPYTWFITVSAGISD